MTLPPHPLRRPAGSLDTSRIDGPDAPVICYAFALLCTEMPPEPPPLKAASEAWYRCVGDASAELEGAGRDVDDIVAAALARCLPHEARVRAALGPSYPVEWANRRVDRSRREMRHLIEDMRALRLRSTPPLGARRP